MQGIGSGHGQVGTDPSSRREMLGRDMAAHLNPEYPRCGYW